MTTLGRGVGAPNTLYFGSRELVSFYFIINLHSEKQPHVIYTTVIITGMFLCSVLQHTVHLSLSTYKSYGPHEKLLLTSWVL